ncbi:single-stranded DNA-binding protein [Stackebrandtia soli]|uniref:single-stranded DNA-binding protein n=1 Tax=Stackebrandtia soli TaxID=1892856 RepID=UPI0039E7789E
MQYVHIVEGRLAATLEMRTTKTGRSHATFRILFNDSYRDASGTSLRFNAAPARTPTSTPPQSPRPSSSPTASNWADTTSSHPPTPSLFYSPTTEYRT